MSTHDLASIARQIDTLVHPLSLTQDDGRLRRSRDLLDGLRFAVRGELAANGFDEIFGIGDPFDELFPTRTPTFRKITQAINAAAIAEGFTAEAPPSRNFQIGDIVRIRPEAVRSGIRVNHIGLDAEIVDTSHGDYIIRTLGSRTRYAISANEMEHA